MRALRGMIIVFLYELARERQLRVMRRRRFSAFSIVELLVVIGIIAILISLMLPMLSNMWAAARVVNCQSNLRQLGQALYQYAHENGGWLIPVDADPTSEGGVRGFGTL